MTTGFDLVVVKGSRIPALEPFSSSRSIGELLPDLGPSDYLEGAVQGYRFWLARYILPPEISPGDPDLSLLTAQGGLALRVTLAPELWAVRWVKWLDGKVVRLFDNGISDSPCEAGPPLAIEKDIVIQSDAAVVMPISELPEGEWKRVEIEGKVYVEVPDHLVPEFTPLGSILSLDRPGYMLLHAVDMGGHLQLAHDPDEVSEIYADQHSLATDVHVAAVAVLRAETGLGDPRDWAVKCTLHRGSE